MVFSTTTMLPPWVRYSTPFSVDEITEMSDVVACFSELLSMFRIFTIMSKLFSFTMSKMSLRISS